MPGILLICWQTSNGRSIRRERRMLLSLAFLLVASFAASEVIAVFVRGGTLAWQAVASLLLFGVVFAAIFKVLPDAVIARRDALAGAGLTALLFAVGKFAVGVYLARSSVGGAYGPACSAVVLLLAYYTAPILLLGVELTRAVARARGAPIRPGPHAAAAGAEAGESEAGRGG
ncbi:YhjD/YihY/BrkB family envelope integrity protein [Fulvimonas soli]